MSPMNWMLSILFFPLSFSMLIALCNITKSNEYSESEGEEEDGNFKW